MSCVGARDAWTPRLSSTWDAELVRGILFKTRRLLLRSAPRRGRSRSLRERTRTPRIGWLPTAKRVGNRSLKWGIRPATERRSARIAQRSLSSRVAALFCRGIPASAGLRCLDGRRSKTNETRTDEPLVLETPVRCHLLLHAARLRRREADLRSPYR